MSHQAELEDEGPSISYPNDKGKTKFGRFNWVLQENMVWGIEYYAGKDRAPYCVKLEDEIPLTKDGALPRCTYYFEPKLL